MAATSMKTLHHDATGGGFRQESPSLSTAASTDVAQRAQKLRMPRPKESYIALLASAGIFIHLVLQYLLRSTPDIWELPLYATLVIGGVPLVIDLGRKLLARQFGSDLLAGSQF
jgi:hypothetical protein